MNNKGFTVVELIITFVIVMTMSLGLFSTVDSYRERQQDEMYKKELEIYKNEVLKVIQNDITTLGLDKLNKLDVFTYTIGGVVVCDNYDQGLELEFKNHSKKVLCFGNKVIDNKATILYGDKKFVSPTKFIKFEQDIIDSENAPAQSFINVNEVSTDAFGNPIYTTSILSKKIYSVNIKLLHEELKEVTYLNVVVPTITTSTSLECSVSLGSGGVLSLSVEKYNKCGSEILSAIGASVNELIINGAGSNQSIKHVSFLEKVDKLVVKSDVKGILDKAFVTEFGLKTVDLSQVSDSAIIKSSLFDNTNIEKLIIKDNKKSIFADALKNIGNVNELEIKSNGDNAVSAISETLKGKISVLNLMDNGFSEIEKNAFFSYGIDEIKLPKSIKKINEFAFYGNNIKRVDFTDRANVYVGPSAFEDNDITEIISSESLSYIENFAFYENPIKGSLTLSAEYIGDYSFNNYDPKAKRCYDDGVTDLNFTDDVVKIGNKTFVCVKDTSIYLPDNIKEVGVWAFDMATGNISYKYGTKLGEGWASGGSLSTSPRM